jgi:DNA-binding response OmpR family regulator
MISTETPPAGELAGAPPPCQMNSPPHILMVEDDLLLRRINTEVLSRSGYEVDAAADGAAAWRALNTDSYDLLITDNNMPKVSGVELLKKLRAARMILPVIMATGTVPEEEFTSCPWLQPAATLLKPYSSAKMLETVKIVLREADGTVSGFSL